MLILIVGLLFIVGIESILYYVGTDILALLVVFMWFVWGGYFIFAYPGLWSILGLYFVAFKAINCRRLVEGKKNLPNIKRSFSSSFHLTSLYLLALLGIQALTDLFGLRFAFQEWLVIIGMLIGSLVLVYSVTRSFKKIFGYDESVLDSLTHEQLPALTVAIPARNETEDLDQCLKSLIASDYPKLEILVLDDCSQERKTPEIIRSFAHDGVRFLAGDEPPSSWTAKNFAYQQLANEANGELLLFCGVDTRFDSVTIRRMVGLLLQRNKSMVSFIPENEVVSKGFRYYLIQPVRYLWEVGFPRRLFNRPPVLSTCWLIKADKLKHLGGFKAVSRSITPERYFAKQCAKDNDGYSFLASSESIGLKCIKAYEDQYDTAIRTLYPALHQKLELVAPLLLFQFSVYFLPFVVLAYGAYIRNYAFVGISVFMMALESYSYAKVVYLTYRKEVGRGWFLFPLIGVYNAGLLLKSMWKYEFDAVYWKGRNVCVPLRNYTDPT